MDIHSINYMQRRSPTWRELPIDLISRSPIARWAPVPLRLIVGYGFMKYGFAKLARGPEAFPAISGLRQDVIRVSRCGQARG
jgi:putative oxidoreductase